MGCGACDAAIKKQVSLEGLSRVGKGTFSNSLRFSLKSSRFCLSGEKIRHGVCRQEMIRRAVALSNKPGIFPVGKP